MSTAASAVTTVDSAATTQEEVQNEVQTPAAPEFDATDQSTWSRTQRETWNKTGAQPTKADSASAKKDPAASSDSATDKDKKSAAETASDSATDTDGKPRRKVKEDTERRFKEILDENKGLKSRLEALERGKASDTTRDGKQASQPAVEAYKPLDEKEYFKANPKATYEDFVRAAAKHEAKWEVKQEIAAERQRQAVEAAHKDLTTRIEAAKKRYPDFDERVTPAAKTIYDDEKIPLAVKTMLDKSPVFEHLLYVLADPAALTDFVNTAKTDPAAAIRKMVLTEQLVIAELAKADGKGKKDDAAADDKGGDDGKTRDATGKFVSEKDNSSGAASETKPRAPKPISEVGGRGTASEEPLVAAAKAGNFRNFEAEMNRRRQAQHSR